MGILKALNELKDKNGLCFKNSKMEIYHKSTISRILNNIGYKDKINAQGFSNEIIQSCLAHQIQNKVASAYNHAEYKKQRTDLLAWWGDKLGDIDLKVLKDTSRYS